MRATLALPDGEGPHPALLVIHEAWGLNDDIRRIAGRFADLGYVALAPDLYDRRGSRLLAAARTMRTLRRGEGDAFDDLDGARRWLAHRPDVDASRMGVVGFCMGGSFALLLGVRAPFGAAGVFYGDVPEQADALAGVCPVLGGYGARDRVFRPKGERLARHLTALGVPHDVRIYSDAGHSFMNRAEGLLARVATHGPVKAGFEPRAEAESWRRMEAFFGEHLGARA